MQAILQPAAYPQEGKAIALPLFRRNTPAPAATPVAAPPVATPAVASIPPTVQRLQKLKLEELAPGDKLVVKTANSTYNFEMAENFHCKVVPSKASARSGEAVLMGGLNEDQSEYTPNRVHVGGRMAYQFPDEESSVLTSPVESIFFVPAKKPVPAA